MSYGCNMLHNHHGGVASSSSTSNIIVDTQPVIQYYRCQKQRAELKDVPDEKNGWSPHNWSPKPSRNINRGFHSHDFNDKSGWDNFQQCRLGGRTTLSSARNILHPTTATTWTATHNSYRKTKIFTIILASFAAFISPVSASIYYPALNSLASDLNVTVSTINLTITVYMVCQGLAPTFIGSISDRNGRRPAYMICFMIYLSANIGLACRIAMPL